MIRIVLIIMLFLTFIRCYDRDKKVDNKNLLGKDYRLFQDTPLWDLAKAVEDENVTLINQLITKKKRSIDYKEPKFGNTLLMLAIENNDYKSVKALLDLGANPNLADNYRGATPMHDAAKNKDPKYLKLLIEYNGDPNIIENKPITEEDQVRETPLILAISYNSGNNLEKVKLLVKAGADINFFKEGIFYTRLPLAASITHDQYEIAYYLLEQGAFYNGIMYKTVQGDSIYILGALRRKVIDINTNEYKQKMKVVSFLKTKGLDYEKEPVPNYIKENIKKKYPNNWQEYLKNY
ncbi:ankyrin repeat domain-containing protein [Empedobacter tilapiae]|uniref:ankyrin repeat domain-containing protein n=1 Tax=Empedobacter tilapiae TaxID=2491114 RepID=UPI0028D6D44E|nr:ankyrin repeat domain-containing protein [Empedobacter tilapiae]